MGDGTQQKRCGRCKAVQPVDQFRRDRSNKDGLTSWCKSCWKEFRASLDYDIDPAIREKRCSRCKTIRPVGEFSAYRKSRDGLCSWCKSCVNEHGRHRSATLNYEVDPALRDKRCGKCKVVKPVGEFQRNRRNSDGLQANCRACMKEINRDWYERNKPKMAGLSRAWAAKNPEKAKAIGRRSNLKRQYGLTSEDYDRLLESQGGKCAGCGDCSDAAVLHVDHDHETGEVRGLLCGPCNRTIGMAMDRPDRLIGLTRYLQSRSV